MQIQHNQCPALTQHLKNIALVALVVIACSTLAEAAENKTIVNDAVGQIKDFLMGDARRVIDLGLLGGGAVASLMRGSWIPVMGGGMAMAVYEILVSVIK